MMEIIIITTVTIVTVFVTVMARTLMFWIFSVFSPINKALNLALLDVKLGQGMIITKQR